MKAGDLKHLITIEKPVPTTDSRSNRIIRWELVCSCRASVADVSARDFYAAQAYQAQDIVTFNIRWRDDVTSECRIRFGDGTYRIEEVNHLGYRRDYLQIKARQTRGEGT